VGPGDYASTRWYLHCPNYLNSLSDHLLSAVPARYRFRASAQDDAELEAAIERDGDADKRGIGLARGRVLRERVGMGEDVVGDDE